MDCWVKRFSWACPRLRGAGLFAVPLSLHLQPCAPGCKHSAPLLSLTQIFYFAKLKIFHFCEIENFRRFFTIRGGHKKSAPRVCAERKAAIILAKKTTSLARLGFREPRQKSYPYLSSNRRRLFSLDHSLRFS